MPRNASRVRPVALLLLLTLLSVPAAADWPTYRGDAARSGYTPDELPPTLALRWTYRPRHAPQPAWPGRDTRMPFDLAFHVAVADGAVFFGSSADGAVRALDAATGAERWSYFTDGPVRFAPAAWKGRLFVVSDDGVLHCLSARDGTALWTLRGGPVDSLVLGNGRMVSRWPARGGPAVADGVVYFGAGIWPSEGIFLYAVDAASGKVVWCNDTAGWIVMPQPHGGANAWSGVSAQGYLVVAGGRLLVPTGRAVPAAFDRASGRFLYFHLQRYGGQGGSPVVAVGDHFLHDGRIFEAASGHATGRGIHTPAAAVTPQCVIHATARALAAVDRGKMRTLRPTRDGRAMRPLGTVFGSFPWAAESSPGAPRALIVAGTSMVVGMAGRILVADTASAKALLTAEVDGAACGLAVADGRLFVSTDRGAIHCFGGGAPEEPRIIEPESHDEPPSRAVAAAAEEILAATGVPEGYCLDLGCGDGALAHALAGRTKLQIYAVGEDPEQVRRARARLARAGLYGSRVSVRLGNPARTAYPNHFADLVVSGRSLADGPEAVPAGEMRRLLRPYGGMACIGRPGAMRTTVRGPIEGAGTWTHQYCDPANTNCSADTVARGPLGVLWFADFDFQMPSRHGRGPAPLFLDGRLFVEGLNALRCIDAYNGRTLWEYPLPGILKVYDGEHLMGTAGTGSNFCVAPGAVFVRAGGACLKLDPATGKRLAALEAPKQPDGKAGTWGYVAHAGGTLFGTLTDTAHLVTYRYRRGDMRTQFTESLLLFALDAATGKPTWRFRPEHSIRHNAIAIGGGRVYLIDRPLALADRKRGGPGEHPTGTLVALDAANGEIAWKATDDVYGTLLALSVEHGVLLMAYQPTRFRLASELGGRLAAFRASDGKRLWDVEAKYASRPVLSGRTIYAQPGAWDLLTGKPTGFQFRRSYGCGILCGSKHLLLYRSATLGYTDFADNRGNENYGGIRPGCWINAIPAGGLVLMPDATDRCTCSYLIKSSVALQPYGLRPPVISPPGAVSRTPLTATLRHTRPAVEIRYTLDGSKPTAASPRCTGPIRLTATTTLSARTCLAGEPPSPIASAEFIVDPHVCPMAGSDWRVHDSPGATPPESRWQAEGDTVTELSNHYKAVAGDADFRGERPGTYRAYVPGADHADGELSLEIASSDNDGLGVAFRFQSPERHYLWAMDKQRGFRVLALKDGKTYRILAHRAEGYASSHWYKLRVVLAGPKITVYLDGKKDLEAVDATLEKGTFALYAWGCAGARFRGARWVPKQAAARTPDGK